MNRLFYVAIVSLVYLSTANLAFAEGVEGEYICKGGNDIGNQYIGKTIISKKNKAYNVVWKLKNETYSGIGLIQGGTLSVAWNVANSEAYGLIIYEIKKDGKLVGKWTDYTGKTVNMEILTPTGKSEPI